MTTNITLQCKLGQNAEGEGIPVQFDLEKLTIVRGSQCSGCKHRFQINFEQSRELEGNIDWETASPNTVDLWMAYVKDVKVSMRQAREGGFFSWQELEIHGYPNLGLNGIACMVRNKSIGE